MFDRIIRALFPLANLFRPDCCSRSTSISRHTDIHSWAALDQCDILAELELLQLAQSLQEQAQRSGGYEDESFDVMVTIADLLEREHGWSLQQSDDWLERMGLYQE